MTNLSALSEMAEVVSFHNLLASIAPVLGTLPGVGVVVIVLLIITILIVVLYEELGRA